MNSHQFDTVSRAAAKFSRRDLLRVCGISAIALFVSQARSRAANAARLKRSSVSSPLPPPYLPWSPENPPPGFDEMLDDYLDCIAKLASEEQIPVDPKKFEQCDRGYPGFDWCQIVWDAITAAIPNIAGFASTFGPFSRNCGDRDCFQCCYTPSSGGCHSSFIGFPVINCNPNTYGAGTKPAGLTFVIDPSKVKPEDSCLFIPQTCNHIAMCVGGTVAPKSIGIGANAGVQAAPVNYLTDPRAIDQRARIFAMQAQSALRTYIERYATNTADARPWHTLGEALLGRGSAGWRSGLRNHPVDIANAALRIPDASGNSSVSETWSNVAGLMALARLLGGLPNLSARLAAVESRAWSAADKTAYLSPVGDARASLQGHIDDHFIAALGDVYMLQDYQLLAVPLAGEAALPKLNTYGGLPLGKAPVLGLAAATNGAQVNLSISLDDAEDVAGGADRAIAIDWGDGQLTHLAAAAGQRLLGASHIYASTGRYAIYGAAAGDSGLRGYAAVVVETQSSGAAATAAAAPLVVSQLRLNALSVNFLGFTSQCVLTARLAGADGVFWPAGRSANVTGPTNITVPTTMGDLYAHNPARYTVTRLRLQTRTDMPAPSSSSRIPNVQLNALTLGIFSTASQSLVEKTVTLTPSMLELYLPGATTPLPANAVTQSATGAPQAPLFWRASVNDAWQAVDRAEIQLTDELLSGVAVGAAKVDAPPGTRAAWIETRPGLLEAVPFKQFMQFMPAVLQTAHTAGLGV